MESIFNWKYLKESITFRTATETFLHIIDLHFFRTAIQLASQPGPFIREYLRGERKAQNPLSFYLSSLFFLFILYTLYEFINHEFVDKAPDEETSDLLQYWITLPFIFVISGMNFWLFKNSTLNFVSNLIVATYIESQSIIYLTFYLIAVDYFQLLNEPTTQALIYVLIIFGNTFAINFRTFQQSFIRTLWKTLLIILTAFIVMMLIAGIFL